MKATPVASALAVAALALACIPTTATAQRPKLDREFKSKEWGYQIKPIKDWNSMPADQDDRNTVGRWKLDLGNLEKRGDYEGLQSGQFCELRIVRVQPKVETPSGAAAAKPKDEEKKKDKRRIKLTESLRKKYQPKNIEEWIEGNYEGAEKRWLRKPLKKSKMQGDLLEFGMGASHVTIGVFRHMGVDWAVVYTSFEERYKKDWSDIYLKSMRTFKVTHRVDAAVAAANRKDPSKLEGEEKRKALHASIAGNPDWFAIDTEHYVFLSNADRSFIQKLSKKLETVRAKVYVPNFKPRNKKIPLSPVRVFATQSEYHLFGGPRGSAGYFSPSKGELVLYQEFDNQSKSSSEDDCQAVMFHEGFHQYIHFAVGDVSPHSWFNEGHGDYFAGLHVSGSRVKAKTFDWRVKYLKRHLQKGDDLIPIRSLIRYPQREYYSNAGLKYSQGWALIYYLREVTKDKGHKEILDTYFNYLADNVAAFRAKKKKDDEDGDDFGGEPLEGIPGIRVVDFEDAEKVEEILSEAVDKAFAKIDLEALDVDLRKWLEKL